MFLTLLVWLAVGYFLIGLAITAFCVHMSYHEAAIGFGDSDDAKAQRVLESKIGFLGLLFLFVCWPLALLVAFKGKRKPATESASAEAKLESSPSANGSART